MNFSSMGYFIAVAEERSFTRAAVRLNVTQQTLSARISSLEKELGTKLFERSVPLELTYAGEVFLGYARRFEAEGRAMRQEFRDIAGDERGVLHVGVAGTRGHVIMPRAIAAFQKRYPGIAVHLHERENDELVSDVRAGLLDVAVATVAKDTPGLEVHYLYREEVVLLVADTLLRELYGDRAEEVVATAEREQSLSPLADCPFLLLGRRDIPGEIGRRAFLRAGIEPDVRVTSTNSETLIALCMRGAGACFSPIEFVGASMSDRMRGGIRMIHLGPDAQYWISVAWRRSDHVWSVIDAFHKTLDSQSYQEVALREAVRHDLGASDE